MAESKSAGVKTGLVTVVRMKQHGIEGALEVYSAEESGIANFGDEVFGTGKRPSILPGLRIDSSHVDAETNVAIFLGDEQGVGCPRAGTFGDVGCIVFGDALMEQLLLVVGQASLTLPMRLGISRVDFEVAVDCRVYNANIEFVKTDHSLELE